MELPLSTNLDFQLGENADMIRDTTHRFATDRIAPLAARIDAEDSLPRELWPEMGVLGLHGITVDEEFEGFEPSIQDRSVAVRIRPHRSAGFEAR